MGLQSRILDPEQTELKNHYFNFISIVTSFLCVVKIIGEYFEHKEKALSREKQREATKISVRLLLIFLLACSVRSPRFNIKLK